MDGRDEILYCDCCPEGRKTPLAVVKYGHVIRITKRKHHLEMPIIVDRDSKDVIIVR